MRRGSVIVGASSALALLGLSVLRRRRTTATVVAGGRTYPVTRATRARRHHGHLRAVVAVLLWPIVLFGWPWDSIWDQTERLWDAIKDKVRAVVESMMGFIVDIFGVMGDFVFRLGTLGVGLLHTLERIADTIIPAVLDTAASWLADMRRYVDRIVGDVWGFAQGAYSLANNLFAGVPDMIWSALRAAIDGFWRDVVAPIARAVDNIWDRIFPFVADMIGTFWRDVVGPIDRLAHAGWDVATEALELARRFWREIWPILQAAWGFLTFVATHPLNWWLILLDDAFKSAPDWFARHVLDAVESSAGTVDDRVARWIAG